MGDLDPRRVGRQGYDAREIERQVLRRNVVHDRERENEGWLAAAHVLQRCVTDHAKSWPPAGAKLRFQAGQALRIKRLADIQPDIVAGVEVRHERLADQSEPHP